MRHPTPAAGVESSGAETERKPVARQPQRRARSRQRDAPPTAASGDQPPTHGDHLDAQLAIDDSTSARKARSSSRRARATAECDQRGEREARRKISPAARDHRRPGRRGPSRSTARRRPDIPAMHPHASRPGIFVLNDFVMGDISNVIGDPASRWA
jgi:hypothetical protein